MRYDKAKRGMDIAISATCLVVLWPALLGLWIAVRYILGPPGLFRQERTGKDHVRFTIFKFRTMDAVSQGCGVLTGDEFRIRPFGQILRQTGLDELPQLWNILRGDMSLIGPRPLLPQYEPLYLPEQTLRHTIRPGMTGWAQVNGRTDLQWEQQFELDKWYVENRSFLLDAGIFWRSLLLMLGSLRRVRSEKAQRREFTGHWKGKDN